MAKASTQELKKTKSDANENGKAKRVKEKQPDAPPLIPEKFQDAAALATLAVMLVLFFWTALFEGKVFLVPDNTASLSLTTFIKEAEAEGVFPLWIPYIFSGMPSYGSLFTSGERTFDFLNQLWGLILKVLSSPSANDTSDWAIIYFFIYGAGIYTLLRIKQCNPTQALIAALGGTFATLSLVWISVGHNTKMVAISMLPFTFVLLERLRTEQDLKKNILNIGLLAFVLNLQARSTHVQMIYYSYLAVGVYFLFELGSTLMRKESVQHWGRSVSGFALAVLIGLMMSADTYLSVLEYTPYSIRGAASITETVPELAPLPASPEDAAKRAQKKPVGTGLDYDYATNWSFGVSEVITFFFPSYFGYGNSTYWGPQPFTACPQFFGTTILALALLGLFYYRRDHFVQALAVIGFLALLISFGKYFPILFDPLFNFLPFFNKFRAPSMILILLQTSACILAGFGLKAIYDIRQSGDKTALKAVGYGAAAAAAMFLVSVLTLSGYKQTYLKSFAESARGKMLISQNPGFQNVIERISDQVGLWNMVQTDMILSLFFLAVIAVAAYLFTHRRLSPILLTPILVVVVVLDLWRADTKLLEDLKESVAQQQFFEKPLFIDALQQDKTKFRVATYDFGKEANWLAYYKIETVGGYSGAKMRLYQDLIEVAGMGVTESPMFFINPVMNDLLNIKYLLSNRALSVAGFKFASDKGGAIMERENPTPRAWFVKSVEKQSAGDIMKAIVGQTFNPREKAFVEKDISNIEAADSTAARVDIIGSGIHHLDLKVTATGQNFLFVSEIYYPPGWKCLIDGVETEIYKTNYAFRGVVVPKGTHDVKFVFESRAFAIGKLLSILANLLVVGMVAFGIYDATQRKRATDASISA